ncbi:MAG TPA: hypothetical protein PK876_01715 [Elusimicrobiota bacterium]|nr:hypothetical protein [Elusimicrobiota bacterium]
MKPTSLHRFLAAGFLLAVLSAGVSAADEKPEYSYRGDRYRDPFIPLTGSGSEKISSVIISSGGEEEAAFKPASIELKGIIRAKTGRWAIARMSDTGAPYLVQDGKIFDSKRKPVKGYVGIVKEKSLVIIGPNNQVTEVKLKKDQQENPATPKP